MSGSNERENRAGCQRCGQPATGRVMLPDRGAWLLCTECQRDLEEHLIPFVTTPVRRNLCEHVTPQGSGGSVRCPARATFLMLAYDGDRSHGDLSLRSARLCGVHLADHALAHPAVTQWLVSLCAQPAGDVQALPRGEAPDG